MPTHVTHRSLTRLARLLTGGAVALTVFGWGGGALPTSALRPALAEDLDCANDQSLFGKPECAQQRETDAANGSQPQPASGSQPNGDQPQEAGNPPPQPQEASNQNQQPAVNPPAEQPTPEPTAVVFSPSRNPADVVLRLDDAGKQATPVDVSEGSDKYGRWAHSRFERDRSDGASTLGPNVIDTKAWVAKDLETAKALYDEQAAIKNFPERKEAKEALTGPVEKVKPNLFGEDSTYKAMYYQDGDNKVWHHYRFVMRQATTVAVIYLFGRDLFFTERKDKNVWNSQGDWYTGKVFERM